MVLGLAQLHQLAINTAIHHDLPNRCPIGTIISVIVITTPVAFGWRSG